MKRMRPSSLADASPVAHARLPDRNRPDAGHDVALGQMPMTHDADPSVLVFEVRVPGEEVGDLRLNGLRQQLTCTIAQNICERIGKGSWWVLRLPHQASTSALSFAASGMRRARHWRPCDHWAAADVFVSY